MKSKKGKYFLRVVLLLIVFVFCKCKYYDTRAFEARQRNALIGEYIINIEKTKKLNELDNYNLLEYIDLKVFINSNSTFSFSRDTPFLYDSSGVWAPRKPGLDEWNWAYFTKRSYVDQYSEIGCQFADSWKGTTEDSVLIFNSMTSKPGEKSLHVIYFDKLKR